MSKQSHGKAAGYIVAADSFPLTLCYRGPDGAVLLHETATLFPTRRQANRAMQKAAEHWTGDTAQFRIIRVDAPSAGR